jgi:hypothetical protein
MRNSHITHKLVRFLILSATLCAFAALPLLSSARSSSVSTAVNIANNSSREIRNVYLSHVNVDDWSANQLGNAVISPGQSYTLSNVACDAQQVRVIGEDEDGCFVSTVVSCGENSTWTVTNDTPRDCGTQ